MVAEREGCGGVVCVWLNFVCWFLYRRCRITIVVSNFNVRPTAVTRSTQHSDPTTSQPKVHVDTMAAAATAVLTPPPMPPAPAAAAAAAGPLATPGRRTKLTTAHEAAALAAHVAPVTLNDCRQRAQETHWKPADAAIEPIKYPYVQ